MQHFLSTYSFHYQHFINKETLVNYLMKKEYYGKS